MDFHMWPEEQRWGLHYECVVLFFFLKASGTKQWVEVYRCTHEYLCIFYTFYAHTISLNVLFTHFHSEERFYNSTCFEGERHPSVWYAKWFLSWRCHMLLNFIFLTVLLFCNHYKEIVMWNNMQRTSVKEKMHFKWFCEYMPCG